MFQKTKIINHFFYKCRCEKMQVLESDSNVRKISIIKRLLNEEKSKL